MPGRAARSRRHTSMPSSRGSMRSSTTRSNGSRSPASTPGDAVADRAHVVAVARQQIDDAVAQAGFVFDDQDPHEPLCHAACKADVRLRLTNA